MVPAVRVVLLGFALLHSGFASRRVKRQGMANPNAKSCTIARPLGEMFRRSANFALAQALRGKSPISVSLHAGRHDIPLPGCTAGIELDIPVYVAGFEETQIESFGCEQDGSDSMTLSSRAVFGQRVETAGGIRANWSACGVNYPNETAIQVGAVATDPGLNVAINLKREFGFFWLISGIETLEIEHGGLELTCALTGIPEFIGQPVGEWCENIIKWLIDKIGGLLQGEVERVLHGLIGQDLTEECDPEYDCDCNGEMNCGKWDEAGKKCHNSDQCDFQWRLGDVSSDQKCRCKGSH